MTREQPSLSFRSGLTAGELRLPSGPARFLRSIALFVGAVVLLAVPMAALLATTRGPAPEIPFAVQRMLDGRTEGQRAIDAATARLEAAPSDASALSGLALAYLQRVRETAEPRLYDKADALVKRALAAEPAAADTNVAAGTLALARHDFAAALEHGRATVLAAPARTSGWGILTDALVELGRYEEAVPAAQRMVDLRPDIASLSRVSYLRELHGDLDGAIDAMRRAVQAGAPYSEATAWSEVQLGHLLFARNDLLGATQAYDSARRRISDYPYALAGLGRVRAAQDDWSGAASYYERAAQRLPLAEFVAPLGDVYARMGQRDKAERQYALVGAMARLLAAAGVRTDVDMALFLADRERDPGAALRAAREEYALRRSIQVTEALAWAELRAGNTERALDLSREALRLGTSDLLLLYRAGVIAQEAGFADRGRALLERSYSLNPKFSVLFGPDLARRLGK